MTSSNSPPSLADLRREIDGIDDALHDLLMRRAALVDAIAAAKRGEPSLAGPGLRPGREAAILRRLLARHQGRFPRKALVRIWRELVNAMTNLQGPYAVAVHIPDGNPDLWDLARDHFGTVVAVREYDSPGAIIRAVVEQPGTVGVLRFPAEGEAEPWWPALLVTDPKAPRLVARLPVARQGEPDVDAVVIARSPLDPSGHDVSLFALETNGPVSRASLLERLAAAGFGAAILATQPGTTPDSGRCHLIQVDGFHDATAIASLRAAGGDAVVAGVWLGGYAVPIVF
ncbi:MAG: chorismate mutase [Alphaproteobacteria bacterium]|nr:chorismate mutase [Alphaproteobacteria bacterium]TAD90444.1 MAG: chorismate mutase [Alphaproteobacteria bacterium]